VIEKLGSVLASMEKRKMIGIASVDKIIMGNDFKNRKEPFEVKI
jgi:hypothetical protein